MKPIRTTSDLLAYVREAAPTQACVRALDIGGGLVLGGFHDPEDLPGWIVQITSPDTGWKWFIGVVVNEDSRRYHVRYYQEADVPWAYWTGDANGKRPLIDGDIPRVAAYRRMQEQRRRDSVCGNVPGLEERGRESDSLPA